MKARLPYIDQLKGLAMMLVIIGHIILFCGLGWDNDYMTVIVMIEMPLFIFLNGLVVSELQNRGGCFFTKEVYANHDSVLFMGRINYSL